MLNIVEGTIFLVEALLYRKSTDKKRG